MKVYDFWRCACCGHLVARDLIDPVPPKRCRHPRGLCAGQYEPGSWVDDDDVEPWAPGEREHREVSAVHYARMLSDPAYAKAHLARARAARAAKAELSVGAAL